MISQELSEPSQENASATPTHLLRKTLAELFSAGRASLADETQRGTHTCTTRHAVMSRNRKCDFLKTT